jgi:uroporphyrinogen III methyltransferase/synthase
VVFTSANGVAALRERLQATGRDPSELSGVRLAAIGSETGAALRRLGLVPSAVPVEFRAEGLVETLRSHVGPDSEVLLVRAAEARDVLPRELAALGARVTIVPAYRTEIETEGAERVRDLLARRRLDVVTFTSSSTVRGLLALLPAGEIARLLGAVVLAAIGPVTAATLAESGLHARIVPREYTTPALADAIAAFFASAARRGVVG